MNNLRTCSSSQMEHLFSLEKLENLEGNLDHAVVRHFGLVEEAQHAMAADIEIFRIEMSKLHEKFRSMVSQMFFLVEAMLIEKKVNKEHEERFEKIMVAVADEKKRVDTQDNSEMEALTARVHDLESSHKQYSQRIADLKKALSEVRAEIRITQNMYTTALKAEPETKPQRSSAHSFWPHRATSEFPQKRGKMSVMNFTSRQRSQSKGVMPSSTQ